MKTGQSRTIALTGMLFALAITFSYVESLATPFLGLPPGVKLGLANVVVLYALLFLNRWQAFTLVVLKAGFALLTRGGTAAILSFSGGLLSFVVMALLLFGKKPASVFFVSVCGALAHNIGQLLVVRFLMGALLWYYLPVLLVSGLGMGALTAFSLKMLLPALAKSGIAPGKNNAGNKNN